jgi:light-regulated signal transduction histidine kinase (bacteriophytochrome)
MADSEMVELVQLQQRNAELESQLRNCAAALSAANKDLGVFSATVIHDLRAPLRHMDGFARMAMDHAGDMDEKTKGLLTRIIAASDKMARLIDGLHALARVSRAELTRRPVDLQALLAGVIQACEASASEREIKWSMDALPTVAADPVLLRQLFVCLIDNALKFTRKCEHAVIEIRSQSTDSNEVEISVRDNGVGFDMRFVDQLYGVFHRLHHERDFEGSGIGLALVRKIIERHGGKTWAEGETGKGAVFYVRLKRA